jgi:hypothetical protein
MSYKVDVGNIGSCTLAANYQVVLSASVPGEFAPGQWFRLAPQLSSDNSVGTSIRTVADGIFIDAGGNQNASILIWNNGQSVAQLTVNWLSTPSHY